MNGNVASSTEDKVEQGCNDGGLQGDDCEEEGAVAQAPTDTTHQWQRSLNAGQQGRASVAHTLHAVAAVDAAVHGDAAVVSRRDDALTEMSSAGSVGMRDVSALVSSTLG